MRPLTSGDEKGVDRLEGSDLPDGLLFQSIPQLLHQLKNHLTVVQNAHFTMRKALDKGDMERLERSSELGILGFQRAEGVLKTIELFGSGNPDRLLDHYRSRYSNSSVTLEYPAGDQTVQRFLPALVYSLEHLRSKMVKKSRLVIAVDHEKIHLQQFDNKEIVPPPILSDPLVNYFGLVPTDCGWVIEEKGEETR